VVARTLSGSVGARAEFRREGSGRDMFAATKGCDDYTGVRRIERGVACGCSSHRLGSRRVYVSNAE
jgi:hypothetical protein